MKICKKLSDIKLGPSWRSPLLSSRFEKGDDVILEPNEAVEELSWDDPVLTKAMICDYPEEKLKKGMANEMKSMDFFKVYKEKELRRVDRGPEEGGDRNYVGDPTKR